MLLLLPRDPLAPRRVDERFRPEADAARELGISVGLLDHDALTRGRPTEALRQLPEDHDAVYRGWTLRSEQYATLAAMLERRGVTMRTSPKNYARAHELPHWIETLDCVTPASAWTSGPALDCFDAACAELGAGPAVLRDYAKSLKQHWLEAAYIPDTTDVAGARAVAERFVALRGEDFTGGFVVRRYETFASAEARTWWIDGRCAFVTAHPDSTADSPMPLLHRIEPLLGRLGLPFVTVDLALRDDGVWRVIELGDGQVSDRPSNLPALELVRALCSARHAL